MKSAITIIDDDNYKEKLSTDNEALVFFTERTKSSYYEQTIIRLSELLREKGRFFLAYIEECPQLCRRYGVRVIHSYYIIKKHEVVDSICREVSVVALAQWYDDVINDRPRKLRYMDHITSMATSSMIAYLKNMDEEVDKQKQYVRKTVLGLESLLDGSEEIIHQFIWENAFLLDHFYDGGFVLSKMPLGNDHITDFVILGYRNWTNEIGIHATLVEIEKANRKLFTKSGDPSSFMIHALRQVQDWKTWLTKNSEFFEREIKKKLVSNVAGDNFRSSRSVNGLYRDVIVDAMNHYTSYSFTVIAGRREGMTISERIRLDELNQSLNEIKIITYDAILEGWMRKIGSII